MTIKNTHKKSRRTNAQLEKDMMDAIEQIVSDKGFINIPFMEFIKEAHIDPNVFYRRYNTINEMYAALAKKYDFWLNDMIDITKLGALSDKDFFIEGLESLHKNIANNSIMQKLLLWELTESNETTRHTSQFRDTVNSNLVMYYKRIFDTYEIDITPIIALFISGIYYLTLHRGIATFCLIDFSTDEGFKKLDEAIKFLSDLLFSHIENQQKQINLAKEMIKDGIPADKICKYLNTTPEKLKALLK